MVHDTNKDRNDRKDYGKSFIFQHALTSANITNPKLQSLQKRGILLDTSLHKTTSSNV